MTALTFAPFAAGLTNQKLALLGLALVAADRGSTICLPDLVDYAGPQGEHSIQALGEVLDDAALLEGLRRFGVMVTDGAATLLDAAETMGRGGVALAESRRAGDFARFDSLCRLLAAMRPAPPIALAAADVASQLTARGVDTGCQMRIERDWRHWTELHRADDRIDEGERLYLDHLAILAKVRATLPHLRRLYVTCNEADLPVSRETIRADAAAHGIELVFRSDLSPTRAHSPLLGAALDFAVASSLPRFLGHTRSTFFGALGLTARGEGRTVEHWLYNNRGDGLRRRTDHGAFVRPWAAANA